MRKARAFAGNFSPARREARRDGPYSKILHLLNSFSVVILSLHARRPPRSRGGGEIGRAGGALAATARLDPPHATLFACLPPPRPTMRARSRPPGVLARARKHAGLPLQRPCPSARARASVPARHARLPNCLEAAPARFSSLAPASCCPPFPHSPLFCRPGAVTTKPSALSPSFAPPPPLPKRERPVHLMHCGPLGRGRGCRKRRLSLSLSHMLFHSYRVFISSLFPCLMSVVFSSLCLCSLFPSPLAPLLFPPYPNPFPTVLLLGRTFAAAGASRMGPRPNANDPPPT